ncbi:immunoglobulin superfamily member 1-like [Petaurus breviceps papuanus]|uniref:immunoglobulin superfamily member 1-like n=1 Tax=Petaurus breviceps papuanus TaxID=3040969 RepID=UPI0036D881F9
MDGVIEEGASESRGERNAVARGIPTTLDSVSFSDPLPRPALWAIPSPVVPEGADVTLRCQGNLGSDRFQLWREGELREERNDSWQQAEFVLKSVDASRYGRSYRCRSGQGPLWSELSEPLALVVTGSMFLRGALLKPSISALPGSIISTGTTVTILCDMSPQGPPQHFSFALLEAKSLEPLQRQDPAGTWATWAVFSIQSVMAEDTGSYSCIYYRKTAPYKGSSPSNILELTVLGLLPKATLWVQPGLVMASGANITLWCSRPKSSLEEVTFTLWKAGTQGSIQQQTSAHLWTSFLIPSVRPEDTGSYSCTYRGQKGSARGSKISNDLDLVVPGSLPKPSLSAFPGLVVEPGMHVTLQCRQPPQSSPQRVTFSLLKVGTPQALQSQSPAGTSAAFSLLSVRAQDAGNYSCVYYRRTAPYRVSELSAVLQIWVTDALPKPSLSAWPASEVVSGANVSLLCQGPSWSSSFVLYKDRKEKILPSLDNTQDGGKYILSHVTHEDSGNYRCSYQLSTNGSVWKQCSEPLLLIVKGNIDPGKIIDQLIQKKDRVQQSCSLGNMGQLMGKVPLALVEGDQYRTGGVPASQQQALPQQSSRRC